MGLRKAAVDLAAGRLELARLVTGGRAGARHAAVPEQVQQLELDQDEAQAEPGDEWQQQQQQQQRGGVGATGDAAALASAAASAAQVTAMSVDPATIWTSVLTTDATHPKTWS